MNPPAATPYPLPPTPYLREERNHAYLNRETNHVIAWYPSPRMPLYTVLFLALAAAAALLWVTVNLPEWGKFVVVLTVIVGFVLLFAFSREQGPVVVTDPTQIRAGVITHVARVLRRSQLSHHLHYRFDSPQGRTLEGTHILLDAHVQKFGLPEEGVPVYVFYKSDKDFDLL